MCERIRRQWTRCWSMTEIIRKDKNTKLCSVAGLTVEPSTPGSCLEFGPFSADCSPPAPRNTRRVGDTSLREHRIHAVASERAGKSRQTPQTCGAAERTTFYFIFLLAAHERERTPLFGRIFGWSATNSTEWEVTKKHPKKSQICWLWPPQPLLISNSRLSWGPWRRNGTERRSSRTRPFLWRNFCAVSVAAAAAVGATCAVQDTHSAAWAHSRGMRGGGATGGAWVM